MTLVTVLLNGENQRSEIERDISEQVRESAEKSQKEYFLREKIKSHQKRTRVKIRIKPMIQTPLWNV